jgi:beta-glucanase (GH16 family)
VIIKRNDVVSWRQYALGALALCLGFLITSNSGWTKEQSKDNWSLVWSDEFNDDRLDTNKWSYEIDCWGGGNEERQCYTDSPDNLRIENGLLKIIARKKRSKGYAFPAHMRTTQKQKNKTSRKRFTSARIRSLGKGDWLYGRFEIRAKLPGGQGVWPAIWMLPSDKYYGTWAASGEIDIMEAVNLGTPCGSCINGIENRVLGTLHFGGEWPDNKNRGSSTEIPEDIFGFHTYALEWSDGKMKWFVDGKHYATLNSDDWETDSHLAAERPNAPFDQRFHMILNLAIGGRWPESVNDTGVDKSGFPKTMEVDYVRVYECSVDPESGKGC